MRLSFLAAALMAAAMLAPCARAADPPPSIPSGGWACDPQHAAWRAADVETVRKGFAAGVRAPPETLAKVEAVLARGPDAPWPEYEVCGDKLVVHTIDTLQGAFIGAGLLGVMQEAGTTPSPRVSVVEPMPYTSAALFVGSIRDEHGQFDLALVALEKGARIAPGDAGIANERAFALSQLHRNAEAIAVIDAGLVANPDLDPRLVARLHRAKGFAFGELARYDEAIAEYERSLSLDPSERASANEITYLKGRKGGAGESKLIVVTSDKVMGPPTQSPKPPP